MKNFIWIFLIAAGIITVVNSTTSCTGRASNNEVITINNIHASKKTNETSNRVIILSEKTFNETIKKGVTLVDFWATWCRPCKMQGPIIEEVNQGLNGKANICKLDIDQNPKIAENYNVQSIPTIIIFKDGKVVSRFLGVTSKETIIAEINKFLK
jgi:thioredoxin 1